MEAEDNPGKNSLSDCCCGDPDKPKPRALIVCVVNDKATKKVEPDYPQEAQTAHISGDVSWLMRQATFAARRGQA